MKTSNTGCMRRKIKTGIRPAISSAISSAIRPTIRPVISSRIVKAVVAIFTAIVLAVMVPAQYFDGSGKAEAKSTKTALQIVADMGLGWNLGNSLDSNTSGATYSDITKYETQWSNPVVTQDLIKAVHAKGFNTIRIPVTWYQHITTTYDSSGNKVYTIDTAWLAHVKQIVDWAYSEGMYVILNIHHEDWINRSDFISEDAYTEMSAELKQVWTQIATYFASYDQHLIFEGMNEPRAYGTDDEWYVSNDNLKEAISVINRLDADFVSTVRSVPSEYQYTRLLMIPDYAASSDSRHFKNMEFPSSNDSDGNGVDDYVAMSIHAYSPYNFTMNTDSSADHSSYSSDYDASLKSLINTIKSTFVDKGIPVIIGEFSASNFGYDDARVAWATAYMTYAKEAGIPCVLWDNNADTNSSNAGEAHGYINRSTYSWYTSGEKVVNALLAVLGDDSVVWRSSVAKSYTHKDYSAGTTIDWKIDSADNAFLYYKGQTTWYSNFNEDTEIAIKYTGSSEPELATMNSSWGGWNTLTPSETKTDSSDSSKIAYFSYSAIMDTWGTANGELAYIKINNYSSCNPSSAKLLAIEYDEEDSGSGSGSGSDSGSGSGSSGSTETVTKMTSFSLTTSCRVGINFYMTLSSDVSSVKVTGPFTDATYTVSSMTQNSEGEYCITCYVAPKNLSDDITVTAYDSNGGTVAYTNSVNVVNGAYVASVSDALTIAESASGVSDEMKAVCEALQDYGTNSAYYFGLGSAYTEISDITASKLSSDGLVNASGYGSLPSGITYLGSSLLLEDEVTVRYYFAGNVEGNLKYSDGSAITWTKSGNIYYMDKQYEYVNNLSTQFSIVSSDWSYSLSCGPMFYCYNALDSDDAGLKNVSAALCEYMYAVKDYFAN